METAPATGGQFVPLAVFQAAQRELQSSEAHLQEQAAAMKQLRANYQQAKDDLAAATLGGKQGQALEVELQKLRADYAEQSARLAAATRPAPPLERAVELFRDEVELWPGDGDGPADAIQFSSYKPPDAVSVDRAATRVVIKIVAPPSEEGARPLPVELALIHIEGPRVVLSWMSASHGQMSTAIRAWLAMARLNVGRQGRLVQVVRFMPLREAELNLGRETPVSLLADLHWREALQHAGWALPQALPPGWTAARKDDLTLRLTSAAVPQATFDVSLQVTPLGEILAQTTYASSYYRLGVDASLTAPVRKAAQDELRGFPGATVTAINRENALALCNVRLKRGQ